MTRPGAESDSKNQNENWSNKLAGISKNRFTRERSTAIIHDSSAMMYHSAESDSKNKKAAGFIPSGIARVYCLAVIFAVIEGKNAMRTFATKRMLFVVLRFVLVGFWRIFRDWRLWLFFLLKGDTARCFH